MSSALEIITNQGVVAIVRSATPEAARDVVELLVGAGVRAIEVSLVTPGAIDVIRDAAASAPKGVAIGVGTALTERDVVNSISAGASFIVSPVTRESVIRAAIEGGATVLPGAATPTEALDAVEWGAPLVKIFPASLWTPGILAEALAAMPFLRAVPTGGVSPATAGDWIRAGAVAVGIGSALSKSSDPAATARDLFKSISEARAQ
jgi:2-dehydro-3-deoxyphosphogluconate aldolase/(4S)-4-hydroxy-2-oxoglutarate aldolase